MSTLAVNKTWTAGLGNQTRREASTWWATGRWWRQGLLWAALLGGLLIGMLWVLPALLAGVEGAEGVPTDTLETAVQFAQMAAIVSAAGVVILTQGVLLDDRRLGLTEWILSKPLARPALVLAKLAGHASGLLVAVVVIPWSAVYVILSFAVGEPWSLARFLGTVALVGLFVTFHLALVLAVSVWTDSRGAVLALPLALLVGMDVVLGAAPWLADWVPYMLNRVGAGLLVTGGLEAVGPVLATGAWTVALITAAVWRYDRQEL